MEISELVDRRGINSLPQDTEKIKFVQANQFNKEESEMEKKEYQKLFPQ